MTSTKEHPGPFDGLEHAAPDEPVFTLRAGDHLSDQTVHYWVGLRRQHIPTDEKRRDGYLVQTREAEEIAWAMADWRKGQTKAPIPVEVVQPQRSSRLAMDADELAAKAKFDQVVRACQLLRNAAADVTESSELLGASSASLRAIVDAINIIADLHQPKRASYAHRAVS